MGMIQLFKGELAREIRFWVQDGIISRDQARAICARYGMPLEDKGKKSRGHGILLALAHGFLGLAAITVVAANWEDLPRWLRMGGMILLTLAIQGGGWLRFRRGDIKGAQGLWLLGSLVFGASIMLIAQVYHIGEHYPDGIFYWALGTLPLGLLSGGFYITLLSVFLGFLWGVVQAFLGYFPLAFPVFIGAMVYYLKAIQPSRILFLGAVGGMGLFLEYLLAWEGNGFNFSVDGLALGWLFLLVCHGVARWMEDHPEPVFREYGILLGLWALRFFILALMALGFETSWEALLAADWESPVLMLGMGTLACFAHWFYSRNRSRLRRLALGGHLIFLIALCLVITRGGAPWAYQLIGNGLALALGIGLILSGIQRDYAHYFFLGISIILLTGLFRYMELLGGYWGTAALFTGFALVLLIAARYWKKYHGEVAHG